MRTIEPYLRCLDAEIRLSFFDRRSLSCYLLSRPMKFFRRFALVSGLLLLSTFTSRGAQSIARVWDERALSAIRVDTPHPPAQARNLFSLSVCMYDAWAAYDTNGAVGFIYRGKHTAPDVAAARSNAISYAAYRMLRERHYYSKTAAATL